MTTQATARRHSVLHRLTVSEVERLTDDAVAVTFEVPDELADEYRFAPGQHVNVALPGGDGTRRSYSICAAPSEDRLRIAVKRIPGGEFSAYALDGLTPGAELDVMTPAGRFTPALDPANAKHYVAIAAGSGITPVYSIIAAALGTEPASRVTLLYGNRTTRSVMFLEELADLKDRYLDRFHIVHVLSREAMDVDLTSGRIDRDRLSRLLDSVLPPDSVDDWFLCGPYAMVTELRGLLAERGADVAHVHSELFHVGDVPPVAHEAAEPVAEGSTVNIVLDGRRSSVTIDDADETVLEAVLQVRNDAPYACKGGVCGTCRAKVLSGAVTMERNYALEADEVSAGYVLTCQSHPTTPEVSLDYDA
ncbi:MAG TPA: 1,2-phenylacetyl-CoA epoxidase subunit PaaE [Jiangellaceae bacterium]|nr:1,2-phenylacetyl-CoA epoxidase subunit PaaE [Jiangellaceae bacterium]